MSTSTPRTEAAFQARPICAATTCAVEIDFARTLETELTAANARIAELEKKIPANLAERCFEAQLSETDVFDQLQVLCGGRPVDECLEPGYEWVVSDSWTDHYDASVEVIMRGDNRINREIADKILDLGFSCIYETHGETATLWSRKGSEPCNGRKSSADNHQLVASLRAKLDSLTRQLSESQAQLEASKKLASDRLIGLCKCGNEREELQAQLASAREAMGKSTAILSDLLCNVPNWGSPEYVAELIQKALDSARGVTSPPAAVELQVCDRPWSDYPIGTKAHAVNGGNWTRVDGGWRWGNRGGVFPTPGGDACGKCVELPSPPAVAETGEKDAWKPIETAPKDGTDFLMCFPLQGNLRIVGWYNKTYGGFVTTGKISAGVGWLWQPLPPPPQGKE